AALDRYPPPDAAPLRDAIARASGIDPSCLLVTPGATAAIHLVAHAYLRAGDTCAIVGPTFGEYAAAARAAGAAPVEVCAVPPDFDPPLEDPRIAEAALTVLCNPNNPTGRYVPREAVSALAGRAPLLLLDAAYSDFVTDAWNPDDLVRLGERVVVVHSMTKLHAVPGLRLGYIVAAPEVIARLAALQPSWSVDAAAQAAGAVAVVQRAERIALLDGLSARRERLRAVCEAAGWAVTQAEANFLLVEVGDARLVRGALLQRGFAVRDCTSFGLPGHIRIAVPAEAHLEALVAAIGAVARGAR
ncbi:MAG: histidinol-phosphate transaminase, partial [Chloroflexi bacterium]|nr:histidinol-phosphate transaminase [Chloroflexota bacterium]